MHLVTVEEQYTQAMRETKAKSRMFNSLQPSEPNLEGTVTLSWADQSEDRVANLETINRLTNE